MQGQDYAQSVTEASDGFPDESYTPGTREIREACADSATGGFSAKNAERRKFDRWHAADRREAQVQALREARDLLAMSYGIGALTHPMDMLRFLDERARSIEAQATPAGVSS